MTVCALFLPTGVWEYLQQRWALDMWLWEHYGWLFVYFIAIAILFIWLVDRQGR
jgi:hypothetical protein